MKILDKDISPAIVVFGSTLIGYLLAFLFELGFLSYYGISYNFVQITPTQLIFGSLSFIFSLFIWSAWLDAYEGRKKDYDKAHVFARFKHEMVDFLFVALSALLVIAPIALIIKKVAIFYIFLIVFGILFVLTLSYMGFYLIKARGIKKGLEEYYVKQDESNKKTEELKKKRNSVFDNDIPKERVQLFYLIILVCVCSYSFGLIYDAPSSGTKGSQVSKKYHSYDVVSQNQQSKEIVVRRYNETLLIKTYNNRAHKFNSGFKTEDTNNHNFYVEQLEID